MNFIDRITIQAINFIYRSKYRINQFQRTNLGEAILCSFRGKGREAQIHEGVDMNFNWAFAKQSLFVLTDKRIVFGRWNIDIKDVKRVEYCKFSGMINNFLVLKITTD